MHSLRPAYALLIATVFGLGGSCGHSASRSATPEGQAAQTESGSEAAGGTTNAEAVPLTELPDVEEEAQERTAPPINDLAGARAALDRGFYEEVQAALGRLGDSPQAKLFQARLLFETGEYARAAQLAEAAARESALRIEARTLQGEALAAVGNLQQAEQVLGALRSEARAHRAHVMLGRLLERQGRLAEAENAYMLLIDAYNNDTIGNGDAEGLAYVGMAAWGLGSPQDANEAFQSSTRADSERVETQLEWAQVFLTKYDAGHAEESVRDALRVNPNHPRANALMARIRIEQSLNLSAAQKLIERALEVNPNLVMAHVTLAGMVLRDLDIEQADQHVDRALAVDANDLEALSTRAAIRYLAEDEAGFNRAKQEVFRRHRTYSHMYSILAEFMEWEHRYPDIVRMSREAVTLNSEDALAHASLGLNLLRMGDEESALQALHDAWDRDHYNVRVYNTLQLYDEIIPQNYEEFDSGPFIFRMHKDERAVLSRYVPGTLERAYRDMVRRYGFTPEGPVRFELFANTEHFALRTTGLPNLGVQGVCFGKVVTAISPEGGPFNWGQISWHELAHVFHIQLSRNRVPRWFTEGLAEYETLIARPEWKREMDHYLWQGLQSGRLPPLRLMNRAFTRARSAMDMMIAYYASTMIVKHIADEHGFDKVVRMLRDWGQGRRSPEVVQRALSMDIDALDTEFRAATERRLAAMARDFRVDFNRYEELEPFQQAAQAAPQDAAKQADLAAALLVHGQAQQAEAAARAAVQLDDTQPIARYVLARMALGAGSAPDALEHLQKLIAGNHDGYEVRLLMARASLQTENQAGARQALEAATNIDAERPEAWQGLAQVAKDANDEDLQVRALTRLVMIDEHDRESVSVLLKLLIDRQSWDEAARIADMVRFVDPHNAEAHRMAAVAFLNKQTYAEALRSLDTALLAEHRAPAVIQLLRARAFMGLNQRRQAREAVDAATAADASSAEEGQRILSGG